MVDFFPGIIEAMRHINKKANLAIVSSNSEWEIDRYLKRTGIRHIFQAICVGTDKRSKSEKILKIMHDLMETKSTTFMVGDCRSDIFQGKKAGVRTIAVTWGYQSRETLFLEEPEIVVDTVPEFMKIFDDF